MCAGGGGAGLVDPAGDGVPVGRLAVLPRQQQRIAGCDVTAAVVVDEGDELRVQRQVPVFAELADRDVQPRPGADVHHGVGAQRGVLADPQPGAQQHLHGDAHQQALVVLRGAQQVRGGSVVEGFGQRIVLAWQVAGEHRHSGRGLVQLHSSIRTKNIRSVPRRWAMVAVVSRGLFWPGRAASHGL